MRASSFSEDSFSPGSPLLEGVDGLTVPGYTGAIGGESSPVPSRGGRLVSTAESDDTLVDQQKPLWDDDQQHYLDPVAKTPLNTAKPYLSSLHKACGSLALIGQSEDGERIAKRLFCGREWCDHCRDFVHNRRIARWLPKAQELLPVGYWVITYPKPIRSFLRGKKALASQGIILRDALKKLGYKRGLTRWHYFGDQSTEYHPHLNALVEGDYLPSDELERQKDYIRDRLFPYSMAKQLGVDLVINYSYTRNPKRAWHWLKYITRATFLDQGWDEPLASIVYGFRNNNTWGVWSGVPKWQLPGDARKLNALIKLTEGLHPISGKPITWHKDPVPWVLVLMDDPIPLGGGYYLLPPIREPPSRWTPDKSIAELPDTDDRKHPNAIRKLIDRARDLNSLLGYTPAPGGDFEEGW